MKTQILFIIPHFEVAQSKYRYIINEVKKEHTVEVIFQNELENRFRWWFRMSKRTRTRFGYVLLATYVRLKYHANIIAFFFENTLYAKELKKYTNANVVSIAHAVYANNPFYQYLHFHYCFVYGQSSINNVYKNPNLEATCKFIPVGPAFAEAGMQKENKDYSTLKRQIAEKRKGYSKTIILSSQWINYSKPANKRKVDLYNELMEYMKQKREFFFIVKQHPLEDTADSIWKPIENVYNIMFLKDPYLPWNTFHEELDVHITLSSASCIELGLLGVPTIFYTRDYYPDLFLREPNGMLTKSIAELDARLSGEINREEQEAFVAYNISKKDFKSIDRLKSSIKSILLGQQLVGIKPEFIKK